MQQARMLGNYVAQLADENHVDLNTLCETVHCSEGQMQAFLKGRTVISYSQLVDLAECLRVPVESLLIGDEQRYNATVVHCMNEFSDNHNREMILDLIDDYMDIVDAAVDKK